MGGKILDFGLGNVFFFFFFARDCWVGLAFPEGSGGKEPACNVGELRLIAWLGRSPGEGNGNPLQYSFFSHLFLLVGG